MLAAPPCFPLYVGAALVVHHRESLIATATEDDAAPFLHGALSKLPGLTSGPAWDSIATSARRLLATAAAFAACAELHRSADVEDEERLPNKPVHGDVRKKVSKESELRSEGVYPRED